MNLLMLNPIWLNTFVTLVDTGHFTQTAEKLYMTQPGVSQHISKLEDACGHSLIKRERKSFSVTEQGRVMYQYARAQQHNEAALFDKLNFDNPYEGCCTLACSGAVALQLYPKLLELQRQYPQLITSLKAAPNQDILSDLMDEKVDQGIVTDMPSAKAFDSREIGQEELCLVVPEQSKLGISKASLLSELGLINHPDAQTYLSMYFAQSQDEELKQLMPSRIPVVGFINQISQILIPIARGIGFTIIAKSVLDSFPERHQVKVIAAAKSVVQPLYLVTKKHRSLPARYRKFEQIIKGVWC